MDHNDNDYEGQNLHLTGEESSKISSVLRPFALPKFNFDDSLQGHLRFDSLVENEVFLGIPSQEDNHWIEDYSRGSSGIVFSSSGAESCALPRHINVWSEATSSESVEMLLKAVRQEEMVVPGENLMEESEPGDQHGSSTLQMENNVRQDAKIDDGIDNVNSKLPLAEVKVNICSSNQSASVVVIQAEYELQDDGIDHKDSSLPPAEVEGDICMSNQNAEVEAIQAEYDLLDAKIDDDIDYGNSSLQPGEVEGNTCKSNQSADIEYIQAEYDLQDAKINDVIDYGNSSLPPSEVEGKICRSNQSASVEVIQVNYDLQDAKIDDRIEYGNSSPPPAQVEVNTCTSNQSAGVEVIQSEYDLQDSKIDDGKDYENSSLPPVEVEGTICRSNQSARVEGIQPEYGLEDAKIDDGIVYRNSPFPPAEVEGDICRSNRTAGVEVILAEHDLHAEETNVSIYGLCADVNDEKLIENSENSTAELKKTSDNRVATCGLVFESLSTNYQENIPVLCTKIGIEKTESSSQNVDVSVKESLDQEKISDISFVSTKFVKESISHWVEEQKEGCKETLDGNAIENDGTERHSFHEFPSEMESPKEHSDEICTGNLTEASSAPQIAVTVSTRDRCNEDLFVVEPSGGSQPIPQIFSSGTKIKQLCAGHSTLHEHSSASLQGESGVGLEVEDSDAVISTIRSNTELKQVFVNQQSYQNHTPVGSEDFHPESHNSFDAPHASFKVLDTPDDKVGGVNHADGPDSAAGSKFDCGSYGVKLVISGMNDAGDTAAVQKENIEDGDHVALPLVVGDIHKSTFDIIPMKLDAREDGLNVLVHEKEVKKLPLDSSDVVCVGYEKDMSVYSSEGVQVDTTTRSKPNSFTRDHKSFNNEVDFTKLTSSYVEGDVLIEGNEHKSPSCDMAVMDKNGKIGSQAPKQPLTSVSEDSSELNEVTPVFESDKGSLPDSETGKSQTSIQAVFLVETSITAMPDEGHKELCERMDNSSNDLPVQDDGAEATHTEKPMEAEARKISGSNSSAVSVASCAVEMDKVNQDAPPDLVTDLPQRVVNNQASLKMDDVENIAEVLTTSKISEVNVSSKEAETCTSDIRPLSDHSTRDSGMEPLSFPRIQACKLSLAGEGSPTTSGSSQTDPVEVKEVSHVFPSLTSPSAGARGPSERKVKRVNSKSRKASVSKGNQVKEMAPLRQTGKWEKPSQFLSPLGSGQLVAFESVMKPRGPVSISTSSLPDLNTSAPSSTFFQQPFTDLQQVQLRAQIFVYGSLIQGAAPDNACMVSAFDGGRDFWEPSWRACVDRLHGEKSLGKNTETPVSLRLGVKAPDRASNKAITSPVVSPLISLSSPLWNTSTPSTTEALSPSSMGRDAVTDYQAVSPLNPFQTPPIQNYVAHTTWSSQAPFPAPFPAPWFAPQQTSAYAISTNSAFPIPVEPIKLARIKELSSSVSSSTNHASPIHTTHPDASTTFVGDSSLDLKKLKVSTAQTADTKSRKRKKSSAAEDAAHISMTTALDHTVSVPVVASQLSNKGPSVEGLSHLSFVSRNMGDQMPAPVGISHYSTSVAIATPSRFVQKETANQFLSMVSQSTTSDQFKKGDVSVDNKALNVECFSKVEEAKFQAQEAAAHAAAAVSNCEGVWSQLGQQNNSGLPLDAQSKLSSAAVAIAAAAAVAKAAAAAAKIASTAASQAKQMADEAVAECETVKPTGLDANLVSNSANLVNASPVSILQGQGRNNAPSIVISAAREASKKRIEAASAATRHAENLDAIVKAAELAADAVSHAGKIVAMGEPFSLSELAESGPNSYWKVLKEGDDKNKYITNCSGEVPEVHMNQHKRPEKEGDGMSLLELSRNVMDDHVIEDNIITSGEHENNFKPQKDTKVSDSANTVVFYPGIESRSTSYTLSSIKEGSYVEVLKDRGDLKKAWFSANVLRLKDGEALVSYTELQSNEEPEPLKEWISLEAKDGKAPIVRIPHEMTAVQIEGTRKRHRAAAKDYTWSVGDKVDAWVQDCWREGIISEKNKNEATALSVHFPVQGETLLVKVWHLRPTMIWSDDQWIEWCGPGQYSASQGDRPLEKRPKLCSSRGIDAEEEAKDAKNMDSAEIGRDELPRLPLSDKEKTFSIGSSIREENKPNMVRTMRPGVEKGRPGVVFGVPKPGKKRKFMDVSKHYVSNRVPKTNVPTNDSVKSAKLLAPQGSGSRGFKNKSKELQVVESRPKAIKSGKPPSIPSRTLARKDESTSSQPNTNVSDTRKESISNDENESGQHNLTGSGSFSNVEETTSGDSMVFSSQALPQDISKKATRNIKSGRLNQVKHASASRNPVKHEANRKLISEASEPRRSNRRIQPTSRLLEGLQSSLLISRIPSSSHGKSHSSTLNKMSNRRE